MVTDDYRTTIVVDYKKTTIVVEIIEILLGREYVSIDLWLLMIIGP